MGKLKCRACSREYDSELKACPNCGAPGRKKRGRFVIFNALVLIMAGYIIWQFMKPSDIQTQVDQPVQAGSILLAENFEITDTRPEAQITNLWGHSDKGYMLTTDRPYDGKYCMRIENGGARLELTEGFAENDVITVLFFARSKGIPSAAPYWDNCLLVTGIDSQGKEINTACCPIGAHESWKQYKINLPVQPGVKKITLDFKTASTTMLDNVTIRCLPLSRIKTLPAMPPLVVTNFNYLPRHNEKHPVFTNLTVEISLATAMQTVADVMTLSEEQLIAILPKKSGVYFVGCANCDRQAAGSEFEWNIKTPDVFKCVPCGQVYPSTNYPMDKNIVVTAPSGKKMEYRYHEKAGTRFYFDAGIDFRKKAYFTKAARHLGVCYQHTGDERYAEWAAVIICQFAKAFPDFVYKYDYPDTNMVFFDGIPKNLEEFGDCRVSRWDWWAYMDIPGDLILAYDSIYNSRALKTYAARHGLDLYRDVEDAFFHRAAEGVFANQEYFNNMAPTFWRSALIAGRVTGAPDYVHIVIERFKYYVARNFFFDGFWNEPTVGYHGQSSRGILYNVCRYADGYSDPEGYVSACSTNHYHDLKAEELMPAMDSIMESFKIAHHPDGRNLPMGDSWMTYKDSNTAFEQPSYLQAAVGHAALNGAANGRQVQLHLYFTPKTGHEHYDTLGISVWANNREIISDLGYTHTKYRQWATWNASHNLVVVDYKRQVAQAEYDGRGDIIYMDKDDPAVQIVSADGKRMNNYGDPYRRTLFLIKKGYQDYYIADFFRAGGGQTYDYLIHGNADNEDALSFSGLAGKILNAPDAPIIDGEKLGKWIPPKKQADNWYPPQYYPYGFFRDTKKAGITGEDFARCTFRAEDKSGFALYVPLPARERIALFGGRNPSVRQAGEDNDLLEKHFRAFVAVRKEIPKGAAVFQSAIEPFAENPRIKRVERIAPAAMLVEYENDVDVVFEGVADKTTVKIDGQTLVFSGAYGYVSIANGKVKQHHLVDGAIAYGGFAAKAGKPIEGVIENITGASAFTFSGADIGAQTNLNTFIRIEHGGEIAHGYFVENIAPGGKALTVKGVLGFEINRELNITRLVYFPHIVIPEARNKVTFYPVSRGGGE